METLTTIDRFAARRKQVGLAVLAVALLLAAGFVLGQRSTWGSKHAQVKSGIAMRANDVNGLIMFDADDGAQATFFADDISWVSPTSSGDHEPSCLRTPHLKAKVEVGLMSVAAPGGGSFDKVVWLRCL